MGSPYDVAFTGTYEFDAPPDYLWESLTRIELFEQWWPWMRDVSLEGKALTTGSAISFRIDPPVPYVLRITVHVDDAVEGQSLKGTITGDLTGTATLVFEPSGTHTRATVGWDLEIANRPIRAAIRVARPLLLWAEKWAVKIALGGFRRYLREQGY
jgi:uncharacterized protein YndB with AHSA1/START domain